MARIIVAGAGHGGIVAAYKLAEAGHEVMIFEKSPEGSMGLRQSDAFDKEAFEYAGIPLPPNFPLGKNQLTLVPLEDTTAPLTLPEPESESIIVDRKLLIEHLISLATKAGAGITYSCEIIEPIILGSRVAGIKTSNGDYYADVIIDACGLHSPVRKNLPEFMKINRQIKKYDILYSYRAYFDKIADAPQPETPYNIYIKEDGTEGLCWVVTEEDKVDILIGRFSPLDNTQVLEKLQELYAANPHIGKNFLYGGAFKEIPVCHPLGVLVADGYASVGDSAFMTDAIKGSGISYSIKSGVMLADVINNDSECRFDTESLWEYEKRFFKEIGFSACRIALVKNMLPFITAQEVNDLFKAQIITTDDLAQLMTNKFEMLFGAHGRAMLKEKIKLIRENTVLKQKFTDLALWIGKLTVTETYFPNKYDRKDVEKWAQKYEELFDSIRKE